MGRRIKSEKGNWTVEGINLLPSDSIYIGLEKAVKEGNLDPQHLAAIAGHHAPVFIDKKSRVIQFANF